MGFSLPLEVVECVQKMQEQDTQDVQASEHSSRGFCVLWIQVKCDIFLDLSEQNELVPT